MPKLEVSDLIARPARCPFDPSSAVVALLDEDEFGRVDLPLQPGAHVVTRYEDVRAVLSDTRLSSAPGGLRRKPGELADELNQLRLPMLSDDDPEHATLRRAVAREFSIKRVAAMRPMIERVVEEALDDLEAAGPGADFIAHVALPIPSLVISELLGVPYADRKTFQERSRILLDLTVSQEARGAAMAEMFQYLGGLVHGRRAQPDADDILSRTLRDHGDTFTDAEVTGLGVLLLIAGHETTANTMGLGTVLLLQHPEDLAAVRDDPAVTDRAVEELLRYAAVVQMPFTRHALEDVEINGHHIAKGDDVTCSLTTANRDPRLLPDGDAFDIHRDQPAHVTFGYGIHQCLGQQLARMELRVVYPALLRRFPGLTIAAPVEELPFTTATQTYGLTALPVTW
ncbi:cytochrome P450 [Catenuloplanes nepalensis]|uniref:Cytochrome P450 n=1 Tax=Catenuloplanes nepalensis TaxID=587533 RepID=A0ABT9MNM2_9ACTN|nr:cytochrome P450 [Catenuloplanes nepalensis]MDP9793007.1 cytochrome P450 [Catenuloplanes nepalensis]